VDRRHELPGDQTQEDVRGEVVLAQSVAELGVLGKCLREWEGDGLRWQMLAKWVVGWGEVWV